MRLKMANSNRLGGVSHGPPSTTCRCDCFDMSHSVVNIGLSGLYAFGFRTAPSFEGRPSLCRCLCAPFTPTPTTVRPGINRFRATSGGPGSDQEPPWAPGAADDNLHVLISDALRS